jgi:shikimate kinase
VSRPAIVFIGFMGAGKSTALAAARRAGLATTEIDELMGEAFGLPIDEAFKQHGARRRARCSCRPP